LWIGFTLAYENVVERNSMAGCMSSVTRSSWKSGSLVNSSAEDVAVRTGYRICTSSIEVKNSEVNCSDCGDNVSLVGSHKSTFGEF
jgi:hypothetical protein